MGASKTYRLGEILISMECIVEEQLERCLQQQKTIRKPIGEILLQAGVITIEQLAKAIERQTELQLKDRYKQETEFNREFAEDAVCSKFLSQKEVDLALKKCRERFKKNKEIVQLGSFFVENEQLTQEQVFKIMKGYHKLNFECESCKALFRLNEGQEICRICRGSLKSSS